MSEERDYPIGEVQALVSDPIRRICTLYKIKDAATGRMIPFRPTPEQMQVIEAVYRDGCRALLILKARQLGMSTCIAVILADAMIWNSGYQASIVDQTVNDATLKLRGKVEAAFRSMPEAIQRRFEIVSANNSQFTVRLRGRPDDESSTVYAGTNARGGTNQGLHVSEWGPIQHDDPERSEEIMTGAIPSAKAGIKFIETTWKGGKHGHLWSITERAMAVRPEDMTDQDYRLFFFPWYRDPQYSTAGNFDQIDAATWQYFQKMTARTGYKFTDGQVLWYFKTAVPMGLHRFAEYPTVLEECFLAPIPGAIYAHLVDQARAEGRVKVEPWDRSALVHTVWDLGSPKNTRTVYFQFVGREIHIIDHDTGLDYTPAQRVAHILGKGYPLGFHLLPHDAAAQERSGQNFEQQLSAAGLPNIKIVPRCVEVWTGINRTGELFPTFRFHAERCKKLLESLETYHTRINRKDGSQTSEPVHDDASHDADAVRQIGEAIDAGLVGPSSRPSAGVKAKVISPIEGLGDTRPRGFGPRVFSPLD